MRVPEEAGDGEGDSSFMGLLASRAPWFRTLGVVLGVAFLIFLPSLTFGTFVLIISLEFLYLAAIDMIVNRAST